MNDIKVLLDNSKILRFNLSQLSKALHSHEQAQLYFVLCSMILECDNFILRLLEYCEKEGIDVGDFKVYD